MAGEIKAKTDAEGVVIPFAAENNDLNEEMLAGKQTKHATTAGAYPREQFGPNSPQRVIVDHSAKRRFLELPLPFQTIYECSVHGKRSTVKAFLGKVREHDFRFPDNL